ncbi:SH3 domain-containing protein [Xanthobacter oligotrophicus]|uniref:SH3 domain-containing protein n=1 Tax=Xanthobacter oligotrophicus TaxID=2607286 RepID=UPI00165D6064|nr:SH3 domain-containing protein [Xanthobacter oligotrophicus]MCG5237306.1 SH3 domain-containing protein [Xanthobacter oligotrophicus]
MAGLGRAQRRSGGMEDTFRDYGSEGGFDVPNDRRDTARPRIGSSTRARPPRRKARDGLVLWRALALSASVLILGMGGVVAYHAMGPDRPAPDGAAAKATAATAPAAKTASDTRPQQTPVLKTADGGHAQMSTKVASILGAPAAAPAQPERANALQVAAASPAANPATNPASAPAEPAPTAADFARPAFLEPVSGDEAGDDAILPEAATQTVADSAPAAGAPLPKAKPRAVALASAEAGKAAADDDGRTVRIRSAVTLRSGPKRSASAITTLDEGTKVTLYSCKSWCEVSSGDKRGFVYKAAVGQ